MQTGTYTMVKPGSPARALACAVVLLLGVLFLASSLAHRRADDLLAQRARIDGWHLSIRPPKRFVAVDTVSRSGGAAVSWVGHFPKSGANVILAVRRFSVSAGVDPASLGRDILMEFADARTHNTGAFLLPPFAAKLGQFEAADILSRDRTAIVRVFVAKDATAIAVHLIVHGAEIDDSFYQLFDEACKSIEFEPR